MDILLGSNLGTEPYFSLVFLGLQEQVRARGSWRTPDASCNFRGEAKWAELVSTF